jgi:hypothetical protein
VGEYNNDGVFARTVVSQQLALWNDSLWWSGTGSQSGSNGGYALSAEFDVDSAHWYAMWVWCGATISGSGAGTLNYGGGGAIMNMAVPGFMWDVL